MASSETVTAPVASPVAFDNGVMAQNGFPYVGNRGGTLDNGVFYPQSDGKRMADSTEQADWMTLLSANLRSLFRDDPAVFVAVDLLWYPVENNPQITLAPDVMVIFGRGTYPRKSYLQWKEADIAPQVVFEIVSDSNNQGEMIAKSAFYQRHGVEEFYLYNPDSGSLEVILYLPDGLRYLVVEYEWTSPRLGVRFVPHPRAPMEVFYPDGEPFRTLTEQAELTRWQAKRAKTAQAERDAAQAERDSERTAKEGLRAKLRELGVDPDTL